MCTISVLISLYNKEKPEYLEQCLDSLVKQTRQPDEVVIVFDGPISKRLSSVVDTYISQLNINVVN
jgi:glycosyltransferase involved in cell wall biosynthesis